MFFGFLEAQNFTKSQVHPYEYVNLHEKSGNAEFLSNGVAGMKGLTGGETR